MPNARRSRDDTRELMLAAGIDVLLRDGIAVGASTFRYTDAFALLAEQGVKVTRGSVHQRIWSSQEAWQLDVISEAIRRNDEERRKIVTAAVAEHIADLPSATVEQRRQVLAESCRSGGLAFIDDVLANPEQRLFPTVIAAWNASSGVLDEHGALGERLRHLQQNAATQAIRDIERLADRLGLAPRPSSGLTPSQAARAFAVTAMALSHSHAMRCTHDAGIVATMSARCPDGEHRPWNALGFGTWLIARGVFHIGPVDDANRGEARAETS